MEGVLASHDMACVLGLSEDVCGWVVAMAVFDIEQILWAVPGSLCEAQNDRECLRPVEGGGVDP